MLAHARVVAENNDIQRRKKGQIITGERLNGSGVLANEHGARVCVGLRRVVHAADEAAHSQRQHDGAAAFLPLAHGHVG